MIQYNSLPLLILFCELNFLFIPGVLYKNGKALQVVFSNAPLVWSLSKFSLFFSFPTSLLSRLHAQSLLTSTTTSQKKQVFARKRMKHMARNAFAAALAFLTAYVISWNLGNFGVEPPLRFPSSLNFIGWGLHIDQVCNFFNIDLLSFF
jgi:hypothetical protein